MKVDPLVSVIVPVYNVEKYLRRCVESLLSQTLREIEFIFVDDCSTDNSLSILKEYALQDDRIRIIESSVNGRQGTARNKGIRAARAEYIGFVDSDDWVSETMYADLYAALLGAGADIAVGDVWWYYGEDDIRLKKLGGKRILESMKYCDGLEVLQTQFQFWVSLFHRDLFLGKELYFPEGLLYEDNAVSQPLYMSANRIVKTGIPCYFYRCDNTSVTRSMNNYHFFDRLETSKMYLQNMMRLGFYDRYKEECEANFYFLFYEASIMGAIFRFSPPEKTYINRIKSEMASLSLSLSDIKRNSYIKKRLSFSHRIILWLIEMDTDAGVGVVVFVQRLKRYAKSVMRLFKQHG